MQPPHGSPVIELGLDDDAPGDDMEPSGEAQHRGDLRPSLGAFSVATSASSSLTVTVSDMGGLLVVGVRDSGLANMVDAAAVTRASRVLARRSSNRRGRSGSRRQGDVIRHPRRINGEFLAAAPGSRLEAAAENYERSCAVGLFNESSITSHVIASTEIGDVPQGPLEGVPEGGCQAQRIVVAQGLAGTHLAQDDGGPHGGGHRCKILDVLNGGGVGQHHSRRRSGAYWLRTRR